MGCGREFGLEKGVKCARDSPSSPSKTPTIAMPTTAYPQLTNPSSDDEYGMLFTKPLTEEDFDDIPGLQAIPSSATNQPQEPPRGRPPISTGSSFSGAFSEHSKSFYDELDAAERRAIESDGNGNQGMSDADLA